jgi:hypothetical protein
MTIKYCEFAGSKTHWERLTWLRRGIKDQDRESGEATGNLVRFD